MANKEQTNGAQAQDNQEASVVFQPISQYVKDLSFECPNPILPNQQGEEELNLQVGVNLGKLEGEDAHEVSLMLKGEAKSKKTGDTLYLIELVYGGAFVLQNLPEDRLAAALVIDGGSFLFPFARRIFMNMVADGGFRPPMLEPVNFHNLFLQAQQQQAQQAAQG